MQKRMARAGLVEKAASPAPSKPAQTKHVTDILVVEVKDGVAALDVSAIPADAKSSAPSAPALAAGAKSPPGEPPHRKVPWR